MYVCICMHMNEGINTRETRIVLPYFLSACNGISLH